MYLTEFERRIGVSILEAFAPPSGDESRLAPRPSEVDYGGTLDIMMEGSNGRARMGTRFAIYFVSFAPMFLGMFPRPMWRLGLEQRAAVLDRMLASDWFVVRELALLLKLTACFALLEPYSMMERSHYHRGRPERLGLEGWHAGQQTDANSFQDKPARKLAVLQEVR